MMQNFYALPVALSTLYWKTRQLSSSRLPYSRKPIGFHFLYEQSQAICSYTTIVFITMGLGIAELSKFVKTLINCHGLVVLLKD